MSKLIIYGLVDPRSLLVRYIGKSVSGMRRPNRHYRERLGADYRGRWVEQLQRAGLRFQIVVLEEVAEAGRLVDAERWWIAFGRACKWPLTNLTDGGEGTLGSKQSTETKAKKSAALMGHPVSAESRAKMSASAKARPPTRLGAVLSEELKAKLSRARYKYLEGKSNSN